jgi:pimeloyl-ACP methyl ester carboxylesterase
LALDVPGCGNKRSRDTTHLDSDAVAEELLSDLSQARMQDVVLVGHSNAGTMLPRMVERQPGLFCNLVYVSCCAPLPGQNVLQMMGSSKHGTRDDEVGFPLEPRSHSHQEQYPLMFCGDMNATDTSRFLGMLGHHTWPMATILASDYRYEHLAAIRSSYVVCLCDGILPVPWQEEFARRLKVERLIHIEAGHQVMITRPAELAAILQSEA